MKIKGLSNEQYGFILENSGDAQQFRAAADPIKTSIL